MAQLSFLGATGTVTGSKFLVEHAGHRVLVDCGLFQGLKELRQRNWSAPPVDPASLDAIVLTHAHLDHTGYLPVMVRGGFRGKVFATAATCALAGILLPDSGHIQEEDARFANKRGFSKHRPALPLYTEQQARDSLDQLEPVPFDKTVPIADDVEIRLHRAGHILGAAYVEMRLSRSGAGRKTILFGGDMGRIDRPIIPDPGPLPPCDHLLLESTYGNRDHPDEDPRDRLAEVARETFECGGVLLIPAFAVGRTQALLFMLRELQQDNRLPTDVPIHVNSPMAINATRVFLEHHEAYDVEMRDAMANGEDPLGLRHVQLAATVEQSKALNDLSYPAIIISASGMLTGGRILHHLAYRLPDHRNTVLLVGYQAVGTRGRALQDGAQELKIHGRQVRVRARVETLEGLSAHADRRGILDWLAAGPRPGRIHLVHGEPTASQALAERIKERLGHDVHLPRYLQKVEV